MSESSTKRPPHTPAPEPARAAAAAPVTIQETPTALPVPRVPAIVTAQENPAAMPDPVALFDAFAQGAEAYADEMAGLLQTGFTTASDAARALLGATTLTEAFEINAGFVRKSLDTMLTGYARLAEIATRMAEDALQPLMRAR